MTPPFVAVGSASAARVSRHGQLKPRTVDHRRANRTTANRLCAVVSR